MLTSFYKQDLPISMMSQFTHLFVDTDPWNSSGHFPSSFQQTWGESPGYTAFDWSRRGGHVLERQQSTSGHCPLQSTLGHCPPQSTWGHCPPQSTSGHGPPQGYSFYPAEASIEHSQSGFGCTQLATPIRAISPHYHQYYSDISSGESFNQWTFQSGRGTQIVQSDDCHNTQFSLHQQSTPCNTHFQNEFHQEYTNHLNVPNSFRNYTDKNYNFPHLPKDLSFDPSKSKWSHFYRQFEQYAKDKHWSSQECESNLKYVLQGKAADYLAYLNELVPNLPYYDLIMQMKQFMESQDLFDPQFNQWHCQRTFNNHKDCSYTFTPNSQDTDYQSSLFCIQTIGTQHQSSFQEPHWQREEQLISYRGSIDDSLSPFDFSGDNAMVHSPFQKIKMLSEGEPALKEMACPENLPCGTLDTTEQFFSFQIPPVAAQFNREPGREQRGRYELYRGSRQGSISSDGQVELDMTCLPNKTEQGKGLPSTECKSEKIIAGSMEEGLASLENKSEKLIMELPVEQSQSVTGLLPLPGEGRGMQRNHKDSMSIEEIEEQLWPELTELQSVPGHSLEVHPKIQESNSEINDFWWDSVGSKEHWPEGKNEIQKAVKNI